MKQILIIAVALVFIAMSPVKKTKIVFFGDSITQAGVKKGGYIDRIQNWINQKSLQEKYELAGAGIGGWPACIQRRTAPIDDYFP